MEKRKAKILLYTDTNQIGGAENHMLNLAKFLDKERFWVALACPNSKTLDAWCQKFKDQEIPVFRLNVKHKHDPRHYFQLKKIIKNEKIDLIHNHVWNPASSRYGFIAAIRQKVSYIFTEHDPYPLTGLKDWLKKKLIHRAKTVIAVSEKNAELLRELYPFLSQKIRAIHNGIDTTWFESQLLSFSRSDREEYKTDIFKTTNETPIIMSIAELHPRKGLVYLLDAASILTRKNLKFKVVIVGEGQQRKDLEQFISNNHLEENVILLGRRQDIPYLLKSSDLFVLPSMNEAFGLVLLEAMIAELPIIATNSGGVPEIITNRENGLLIEPRNSKILAAAIEGLFLHPELMQEMSEKNYEKVKNRFDVKNMVKSVETRYSEALGI